MTGHGMGWVPDYPDIRDSTLSADRVQNVAKKLRGVDTSDRVESKIKALTGILHSIAALNSHDGQSKAVLDEIEKLKGTIEQESAEKIDFFTACFEGRVLAEGSEGTDVKDIQLKLKKLGYYEYTDDQPGYFDSTLEESVRIFQWFNLLDVNGMVSSVMNAELTALAALAGEMEKYRYRQNFSYNPHEEHHTNTHSFPYKLNELFVTESLTFLGYSDPSQQQHDPNHGEHLEENPLESEAGVLEPAIASSQESKTPLDFLKQHYNITIEPQTSHEVATCGGEGTTINVRILRGAIKQALIKKALQEQKPFEAASPRKQLTFVDLPIPDKVFDGVANQLVEIVAKRLVGTRKEDLGLSNWDRDADIDALYFELVDSRPGSPYISYLEYLKDYPGPSEINLKCRIIKKRIAPLVEVIIQLLIYQGKFNIEFSQHYICTRAIKSFCDEADLEDAYQEIYRIYRESTQQELGPSSSGYIGSDLEAGNIPSSADEISPSDLDYLLFLLVRSGYRSSQPLDFDRVYKFGDIGLEISYLQDRLRTLGYYNAPTTGFFESLTERAVFDFQTQQAARTGRKVPIDGRVGPETMTELEELKKGTFQALDATPSPKILQGVVNSLGGIEKLYGERSSNLIERVKEVLKADVDPTIDVNKWIIDRLHRIGQQFMPKTDVLNNIHSINDVLQVIDPSPERDVSERLNHTKRDEQTQILTLLKGLIVAHALSPIVNGVAHLLAPIGQFDDLERAIAIEVARFKIIAQLAKFEEVADQIKQTVDQMEVVDITKTSYIKQLESWRKRFQSFVFESRDRYSLDLIMDWQKYEEFKTLCHAAMKRLQDMGIIESRIREAIATEVYKELTQDIENFQRIDTRRDDPISNNFTMFFRESLRQLLEARNDALINFWWKWYYVQLLQESEQVLQEPDQEFLNLWFNSLSYYVTFYTETKHENCLMRLINNITCVRIERQTLSQGEHHYNNLQVPTTGQLSQSVNTALKKGNVHLVLPPFVDLSRWCTAVKNQGSLDACTAHAGVSLLEFFEKKSYGRYTDISRRFLYKVTRNLMQRQGDTGASVRETMKAMVLFGVPPENYCPYDESTYDDDPSAFCYAFAQNYQAITYFRLDDVGMSTNELLAQVKIMLVAGFPCMFGFTVYDSIHHSSNPPGHIPFPKHTDRQEGGHAVITVGYDDYKQVKGSSQGALLIKNSWGKEWGVNGYGWLPYDYVLKGLARDWWSLIKSEWIETGSFGISPDASSLSSVGLRWPK